MHDCITWIGMDVHKESIVVTAVGNDPERIRARFELSNTDKGINRLVAKIQEFGNVRCVYEAGPCGFELRRILDCWGIPCDVVAPSLIPKKAGDRVKTDRRDAEKPARLHRMGELTPILVPSTTQDALRDLIRAREDAKEDVLRRRHRLLKFLSQGTDGLCRAGPLRIFQRREKVSGAHHKNRKRPRATRPCRICLALPAFAHGSRPQHPEAQGRTTPQGVGDRKEGRDAIVQEIPKNNRQGEKLPCRLVAVARELAGFVWAIGKNI